MVIRNIFQIFVFCLLLICSGNVSLEKSKCKKPFDWLPDQGWEDLVKLAELFPELFSSLPDDVARNASEWKCVSHSSGKNRINATVSFQSLTLVFFLSHQWYDLDGPEQVPFPMKYAETLTPFQKLLLLRCFRVDRVYRAVTDYITVTMNEK